MAVRSGSFSCECLLGCFEDEIAMHHAGVGTQSHHSLSSSSFSFVRMGFNWSRFGTRRRKNKLVRREG